MEEDETEHLMKGENGKILKDSIGQLKTSEMKAKELGIKGDAKPYPIVATNSEGVKIVEINNKYFELKTDEKCKLLKQLIKWCEEELLTNPNENGN